MKNMRGLSLIGGAVVFFVVTSFAFAVDWESSTQSPEAYFYLPSTTNVKEVSFSLRKMDDMFLYSYYYYLLLMKRVIEPPKDINVSSEGEDFKEGYKDEATAMKVHHAETSTASDYAPDDVTSYLEGGSSDDTHGPDDTDENPMIQIPQSAQSAINPDGPPNQSSYDSPAQLAALDTTEDQLEGDDTTVESLQLSLPQFVKIKDGIYYYTPPDPDAQILTAPVADVISGIEIAGDTTVDEDESPAVATALTEDSHDLSLEPLSPTPIFLLFLDEGFEEESESIDAENTNIHERFRLRDDTILYGKESYGSISERTATIQRTTSVRTPAIRESSSAGRVSSEATETSTTRSSTVERTATTSPTETTRTVSPSNTLSAPSIIKR